MQDIGFWILNDIVWSKPNAVPNFSAQDLKIRTRHYCGVLKIKNQSIDLTIKP